MFGDPVFEVTEGYGIDSIAFSNNIIICGQSRKEGNIWDGKLTLMSTDTSASIENTVNSGVSSVACSASTGNVFAGRDDGNLSIFSDCLEEVSTISVHDDILTAVSVDPFDDARCVTVSWDGQVGLVDCSSSHMEVVNGHSGIINGISHNTKQTGVFGTVGKDSFLRLWDSRCIHEGCTSLQPLHQIGSACCWSSQSEHLIACGMEDGCIHVVDVRNNKVVTSSVHHAGRISRLVAPSPSSRRALSESFLISSSVDKSVCVQHFDALAPQHNRLLAEEWHPTDIAWAEDSSGKSVLVVSGSDGRVRAVGEDVVLGDCSQQ